MMLVFKRIRYKVTFLVLNYWLIFQYCGLASAYHEHPEPPHPPYYPSEYSNDESVTCSSDDGHVMHHEDAHWTSFNIFIDHAYTNRERSHINDAMWTLSEALPCIPFLIWPDDSAPFGDYVYIRKGLKNGCSSVVGRQGGIQLMNLQSPGCMQKGTIIHEMLHALGLHHEHGRPDRDDFIDIQWGNIRTGLEHAFRKYSPGEVISWGVPYNRQSIMHYNHHAFSGNGRPTILTKDGFEEKMGSLQLQVTDIEKLQRMYNCSIH